MYHHLMRILKTYFRWLIPMRNLSFVIFLIFLFASKTFAVDGFNEFNFADHPDTVLDAGRRKCEFARIVKDTRWLWKSYLSCKNYDFKKGVKATIHFDFSNNELRKIYVVSVDMKDYFLLRHPRHEFLIPIQKIIRKKTLINLADELITKDKIHVIDKDQRYINFFYKGRWEWEFVYKDVKYVKKDLEKEEDQLEDEAEEGLTNWNDFAFDDEDEVIKKKLEGFCASSKTVAALNSRKVIHCSDFPFMKSKINVLFSFINNRLINIELQFEPSWYETLLPLLKRKYGQPYSELEKNDYYYPYIDFPGKNILLIHRITPKTEKKVMVSLIYYKEGYLDKKVLRGEIEKEKSPTDKMRERSNKILDSL